MAIKQATRDFPLPFPVDSLVPHQKPIRMIDTLVEFNGTSGVVETLLDSGNPLIGENGVLDRIAFVEILAQSYAAVRGYRHLLLGKPTRKGFLVSAKEIEFRHDARLGDRLRISVSTTGEVSGFFIARGVVMRDSDVLAEGTLTLWIPEEETETGV